MPASATVSREQVSRRAREIYEQIRSEVEKNNEGRLIAIDINSSDFEIANGTLVAAQRLRTRRPEAIIHLLRIGYPAAVFQGGRRRHLRE